MDYNSFLFLEYIKSMGFKPNNYYRILELLQSSNGSISQYLTNYNQYLLSRKVCYSEIDNMGIDGAYGYIYNDGSILVPKCFINDGRFLHNGVKTPYIKHSYGTPTIDEFDAIIGRIPSNFDDEARHQLIASLIYNFDQDQFFGLCLDTDKTNNSKQLIASCQNLVEQINTWFGNKAITIEHDTIQSKGKELCLIKRSK